MGSKQAFQRMKTTTTENYSGLSTDIKAFIQKFEPRRFKALAKGIEVRGASDIHRSVAAAKDIIARWKLKLAVIHSAEMAGYGAFEVRDLNDAA